MTWHVTVDGEVIYACHQPGHYAAGMKSVVVPDKLRWVVALGVLWRIWVLSIGVYVAILVVVLLVALVIAVTSS